MDEILGLDVPLLGPLAKLPLLSVNLPVEFARLRAFLLGEVAEQR
ncbi:threonine synthase [Aeromonas hydrophila]|nr:threonine synthase [Aeromonas hydrophila]